MTYIAAKDSSGKVAKVIYQSKDAKTTKTFDALDWLAQLVSHIPNKGEQMVRYYGFYSNKSRGLRKKAGTDDQVPALIESDISSKEFRKNWARLIQKVYNVLSLRVGHRLRTFRLIHTIGGAGVLRAAGKRIVA